MKWKPDWSVCPICGGAGRDSKRYPAALCETCVEGLVDIQGRGVQVFNEGFSGGLLIKIGETTVTGEAAAQTAFFVRGVECRAREHRFGGIVVQPRGAWELRTMRQKLREATVGDATLRLFKETGAFKSAVIVGKTVKVIEGDDADDVWRRMHDEAGRANPKYFGFDGARNRFLGFFPEGFRSKDYDRRERDYKIDAKSGLDKDAPLDKAASGAGYAKAALDAFQTNLLSPFEKMRIRDALRGPAADDFVRAAAQFTLGGGKPALAAMEAALKPHDAAKWTTVTYLPFLWRPEEHMFLKPEATKDFATRVGHRFAHAYEARLDLAVYDSLLDLAARTATELSDLEPRDRIDVQSFIWVVGNYKDESGQADVSAG